MKLYYYIILVFIIFINQSHAKIENSNIIYKLSLKSFGLSINLGEINSYFSFNNKTYSLEFTLKSNNLVNIITPIFGTGKVNGLIENLIFYPLSYQYEYTRREKTKNTEILFDKSKKLFSRTIPEYDKSKLTSISPKMLQNVIDPITAIIYMGNHKFNNGCSKNYRIYDGKRRYDLKYIDKYEEDGYLVCKLLQYKIGGFKLNDNEVDPFKPAQEIVTYFEIINDEYTLRKIVTKSKFAKIRIDLDYL